MKSLLLSAALMLQSVSTANIQQPASIEGIVVNNQMQPVVGAMVRAFWEHPPLAFQPDQVPGAFTDNEGKFRISNLSPGGYRVSVSDSRYVRQTYGEKATGGSGSGTGTVIAAASGENVREISFRLTPMSTISGRVISADGKPLTGFDVAAVKVTYDSSGIKTLVPATTPSKTDDRGEYRIAGIGPGHYYVRAESPAMRISDERQQMMGRAPVSNGAYASAYYLGSGDFSGATALEVRESDTVRDINFVLSRLQTFKIRGHLLDAEGKPLIRLQKDRDVKPPTRPMLGLLPIQPDFVTSTSMSVTPYCGTSPELASKCENLDGGFELTDVAPGFYWITAQLSETLSDAQRQLLQTPGADPALLPRPQRAMATVRVTNSDVDGVELKFHPNLSINVRVLVDDSPLSTVVNADSIKIGFRQSYAGSLGPVQAAVLNAQGRFSTGNLLPGEYRVEIGGLPQGVFLVDAHMGEHDYSSEAIRLLTPPSEEMTIRLSAKSGSVHGTVVDSSLMPVANASVVLVPVNESRRPDRYRTAVTGKDGSFHVDSIAPGDYIVFSWEALQENAYFDPSVVRPYASKGKSVHVVNASNEKLQITQIVEEPN